MLASSKTSLRWLCKASWRGTALHFYVEAKDEEAAWVKAANQVKKQMGAETCLDITVVKQVECV